MVACNAGGEQKALVKLIRRLWKRHGREDVALAALLWQILTTKVWELMWTILASNTSKKAFRRCY